MTNVHLKNKEYFFKITKIIVKIGTSTILIKTCLQKTKLISALASQMCKSYKAVNHWILPLTWALLEFQHMSTMLHREFF